MVVRTLIYVHLGLRGFIVVTFYVRFMYIHVSHILCTFIFNTVYVHSIYAQFY